MKLYNLLLRLYPSSFRNEYGEEMRPLFARRLEQTSGIDLLVLWLSTIGEVFANALAVHLDILKQDLSYTGRVLRRTPGFAITAVLIVAIGVGATTAAFSVTDFVLLRPLPFPEADRLVKLWERTPGYGRMELSAANYRDWKQGSTVFERVGLYHMDAGNLVGAAEPVRVEGAAVSADLFPTLRVRPLIGRLFEASDGRAGAAGTVLLSYRLWQTQFGGEAAVMGREVRFDADSYTVIGIMPSDFRFPSADSLMWRLLRPSEQDDPDRQHVHAVRHQPQGGAVTDRHDHGRPRPGQPVGGLQRQGGGDLRADREPEDQVRVHGADDLRGRAGYGFEGSPASGRAHRPE